MENENKDLQGVEQEETLTPEERVKEDISTKIADAAAEVEEEIKAAELGEEAEEVAEVFEEVMDESWSDEAWEGAELEEVKPEPVRVTVKKNTFILSLIGSAILGALILFLGMQIPGWVAAMPEGSKIASVNGEAITDLDVSYYIYAQVAEYANENGMTEEDMKDYDWDVEVDGEKLSDTLKKKAMNDAVKEVILIQKGVESGAGLSEQEKAQLDTQINGIASQYGEEGFKLRARTMGIASTKQYAKMYEKVMTVQAVQDDMEANPDKYYPEDDSVLNDYIQPDGASVKHILISTKEEEAAEGEEAVPVNKEEKLALAQSILERAKNGEDFDALVAEFNEDPGATEAGYTFGPGEMLPEFEATAFALKIGEISDIVETSYGYHIIKRIPGTYELQAYWTAGGDGVKINNRKLAKLSINDIMADVFAAMDELEAQTAAK